MDETKIEKAGVKIRKARGDERRALEEIAAEVEADGPHRNVARAARLAGIERQTIYNLLERRANIRAETEEQVEA